MKTLMYLGYGPGPHIDEIVFSILSALRWGGDTPSFRIVVYTDVPQAFRTLPVRIELLNEERLRDWDGPHDYKHRRKVMALADALQLFGGRVALVDGDTWFKHHPDRLFDLIAPRRSLLHVAEGRIASVQDGFGYAELAEYLVDADLEDHNGVPVAMPSDPIMWNSGVVGLHESDAHLLPRAVHLMDQIWSRFQRVETIEQFAVGFVLERGTRVRAADRVVFHYWMSALRMPFRSRLSALLSETSALPPVERAGRAYTHRPRPRLRRLCRLAVVHRMQDWGLMRHRMRASG